MATLLKGDKMLWRVYQSDKARRIALALLRKQTNRFNYFVLYRDVQGFALNAGWADWVKEGTVYVDR